MTDAFDRRQDVADGEADGPVIRDKRRIDPQTGQVRDVGSANDAATGSAGGGADDLTDAPAEVSGEPSMDALAGELLGDLQRLQAEYVNYRKRVERDRNVARDTAVAGVLDALMPVLDDIQLAREHGDLDGGPFAAVAEKFETILGRFGMERFGTIGEPFDPAVHEALMHTQADLGEGVDVTTVTQVMQPGYRAGERVLRAARVAVADPE